MGAKDQNRTGDTTVFSRVLYLLSYLGLPTTAARSALDHAAAINRVGEPGLEPGTPSV